METKVKPLHMNVNGTDKKNSSKKELVERELIDKTPFEIITVNGESFGTMGQYRLTEKNSNKEEVRKEITEITWNRIVQIIMILDEMRDKVKTNKK